MTAPLTIGPQTTIHALLKEFPFLRHFVPDYYPRFKRLTNPVFRSTLGWGTTLEMAAGEDMVPLNRLVHDIADEVERRTGVPQRRTGVYHQDVGDLAALRTMRELLDECRADPEGAATEAYHNAGYVWTFDQKLDRERCFRYRADHDDSFEHGLPDDEQDRRRFLAGEIDVERVRDAAFAGWRHFRFCECRSCNPPRLEPKDHSTLEGLMDAVITAPLDLG